MAELTKNADHVQQATGCTLAQYAEAKQLPWDFLKSLGLSDIYYANAPAVRIPYRSADEGEEGPTRFRISLEGKERFRWKKGSKLTLLYENPGMKTLDSSTVLVEGESDCHTLWHYGVCAYGLAGAGTWKESYAKQLAAYDVIYVLIEPDTGGEALLKSLANSAIRHKARLIRLDGYKDPSALHCSDPELFVERWQHALASSVSYEVWEKEQPASAVTSSSSKYDELMLRANKLEARQRDATFVLLEEARSLNGFEQHLLHSVIKAKTGFTLGTLRAATSQMDTEEKPDHLQLAREVVADAGQENLLATASHVWLWRDAGVWRAIEDRKIKQLVQQTLERKEIQVMRGLIDNVTDVMKTEIFSTDHQWNVHSEAINFLNGELHWTDNAWELQPHQREHYRTTLVPHNYYPEATCERFEQFLHEVFSADVDAAEKATLIKELIGYTLVSHARLEVFALLIGSGANGKSVLLDVIRTILGAVNVTAVQPSQFSNRFQRAHLDGKLANIVTEIAEGAEIADAELKAIVSGELMTAEHKNKDPFDFLPFCTCWFGTNHMPHTRDFSDALFRRAKVITFNRKFTYGVDADPLLKSKLADEIPGIISSCLQAFSDVMKRGCFTEPQSCLDAKEEWRFEADQVAQFLRDKYIVDPDGAITSAQMYIDYNGWSVEAGIRHKVNRRTLTDRVIRLGGKACKGTGGTRMISGFRMKPLYKE